MMALPAMPAQISPGDRQDMITKLEKAQKRFMMDGIDIQKECDDRSMGKITAPVWESSSFRTLTYSGSGP